MFVFAFKPNKSNDVLFTTLVLGLAQYLEYDTLLKMFWLNFLASR